MKAARPTVPCCVRPPEAEAQKHRSTEAQKHRSTEAQKQKHGSTEAQKHRSAEAQKHRSQHLKIGRLPIFLTKSDAGLNQILIKSDAERVPSRQIAKP